MKPAIVQSIVDFAVREINATEVRIMKNESDVDEMLWEQARLVSEQLDAGVPQRVLAAQWINARTGEPYSYTHVQFVARVYRDKFTCHPRPPFRDAYNEMANTKSIHYSSETAEHYTPKEVLDPIIEVIGGIDLDPCSNAEGAPNVPARRHFTADEDGLARPWSGRVFVNPPYGDVISQWTRKIRDEWRRGGATEIVALLPARPDTAWWDALTAGTNDLVVCFWRGRLTFLGNRHPAPFPSAVIYFGPNHDLFAHVFTPLGSVWMRPPVDFFVNHGD